MTTSHCLGCRVWHVAPGGDRLVTTISELNHDRTEYVTVIWELDPTGVKSARQLTHGAKGESAPVFTAGGVLLFVAVRPRAEDDEPHLFGREAGLPELLG